MSNTTNTSENLTKSANPISNLSVQYLYIAFASVAFSVNLLIIIVTVTNKGYFKKSAFISGLALGDIVLSCGTALSGALRIKYINLHTTGLLIHPFRCLHGFTTLLILGTQIPSAMIVLIGIERVLAVAFSKWYNENWSTKQEWLLTGLGYMYCFLSISSCWILVGNLPNGATTPMLCTTSIVVGPPYATYHFGMAVMSGFFSLFASSLSLITLRRQRRRLQSFVPIGAEAINNSNIMNIFVKKQWRLTKTATCLALSDVTLVVAPNILLNLTAYFPSLLLLGNYATCMLCTRSAVSILIYFVFNYEFRQNFASTFKYKSNVTNVIEIRPIIKIQEARL